MREFKKFSQNNGTFFWVPVSNIMRAKTLIKGMGVIGEYVLKAVKVNLKRGKGLVE
jgi:hypothetical protein